ncbi:MAG: glycosyltransferase family 9 protein [Bdellovibrionaceae bacterium]|nr:glycosyltransferase family 9 protein [Pseudobdellovibrionaceae bacterium]
MKTLVLQLARLGDIYQTWPVLRAIRRGQAAGDELHVLVRSRFRDATEGLDAIDRVWTLDTKEILAPLVSDHPDAGDALDKIKAFVEQLSAQGFERIINLSFSPFSSRLVYALAEAGVEVRGYTRHEDGFLQIPDDASAYFFAQVGPDRVNRVHVTELFAQVAGVELVDEDWTRPAHFELQPVLETDLFTALNSARRPVLVHLGASQSDKVYGTHKWLQVISGFLERIDAPVVLIGSADERELAKAVRASASGREAIDLVGRTRLRDVFALMSRAQLAIGGDSAPVHIAALTGTPFLNLSFRTVSFWETGPKSPGSRILAFETADDLPSDLVIQEAVAMLNGVGGDARAIHVTSRLEPLSAPREIATSVGWEWLQAIYMGQPFPGPDSELCVQGLFRLSEANALALEQLAILERRSGDRVALSILDRFDEIIEAIARMVPTLGILVRWFQTERVRLGPMADQELLTRTIALHRRLGEILALYTAHAFQEKSHDDVRLG